MNRPLFLTTLSIPSYDIGKYVGLRTYQHPTYSVETCRYFKEYQSFSCVSGISLFHVQYVHSSVMNREPKRMLYLLVVDEGEYALCVSFVRLVYCLVAQSRPLP